MKNYHTPLWSIKSLSSSVSPKSEMPGRKRNQMHPVHMRVELFPHTSSPSGSGATVSRAVKRKHPGVCCVFACLLRRHCQGALHNSGDHRDFNTFPFKISDSVTEVKNKPQNPLARIEKSQQSIAIEQQKPMAIYGEIMEIKGSIC